MSYLVLARKWRPQTFQEVAAQSHVVQALQNAIRLDRLPHALLLTGSRGVGKTTIARLIAKTVNCQAEDRADIEPCNVCGMCEEITAGRAVDVIEIDGASNRSIDDIRELRENVQYLPNRGRRKVYIIDEVHMLTREAFNALLKTLEEPPQHVLFLFATTEPHKIPITILSRCQRFDFKRIAQETLKQHLRKIVDSEGILLSDNAIAMVARAAQGGMRDGLSLLDQVIAFGGDSPSDDEVAQAIGVVNRKILHDIGHALLHHDPDGCLRSIEQVFAHAHDMRQFTQELATFLRDLMVVQICREPAEVTDLSDEELNALHTLARDANPDLLQQMFRILTQSAEEIAHSNHPRLLLEMTLLRMARLRPVQPFDAILKQLSDLERRIRDNPGGGGGGGSLSPGSSAPMSAMPHATGFSGHALPGAMSGGGGLQIVGAPQSAPHVSSTVEVPSFQPTPQARQARQDQMAPRNGHHAPHQNGHSTPNTQPTQEPAVPATYQAKVAAPTTQAREPRTDFAKASERPKPSSPPAPAQRAEAKAAPVSEAKATSPSTTAEVGNDAKNGSSAGSRSKPKLEAKTESRNPTSPTREEKASPFAVATAEYKTPAPATRASSSDVVLPVREPWQEEAPPLEKRTTPLRDASEALTEMSFWDWESYVQNLRHKKSDKGGLIFLIDSLEKARYTIDVASRTLRLYFQDEADHRFAYTRLQDSDRLKALERFLEEDGYPLRFSLHQLAQGELANHPDLHDRESIQEAKERRKRAFFERLRREVEEHEVFQALAKAFPGTEIRSVTPLKASAEVSA